MRLKLRTIVRRYCHNA